MVGVTFQKIIYLRIIKSANTYILVNDNGEMRFSMFIYVVKMGDSLFSIAARFQVNMDSIRITNELITDSLVPGQDLLIPTNMYTVQPGDSLFSISKMSFLSIETIRLYNGLQSNVLMVGMRLYLPPRAKYPAENLSYMYPTTPEQDELIIRTFAPINTYLAMFEYHILEEGELSQLDDEFAIQIARNNRVAPVATITNLTPGALAQKLHVKY